MNQRKFRSDICLGLICGLGFCHSAKAQVYSSNIVGYINLAIYAGNNLFANQLANSYGNSLSNIFQYNIPEGATFTKWNSSQLQFLPLSTYDTNSGWSINYDLTYGEGGRLNSPAPFTNTFVGTVWPGYNGIGPFVPPLIASNGLFLLSCVIPIAPATFYDVVGRNPLDGESVRTLDTLSQLESTTTFGSGVWDHGAPSLAVGQAAFFNLGPISSSQVPEPTTWGLFGSGLLVLAAFRNYCRRI